jgi:ligand-binding sensor domain-containing protein
MNLNPAWIGFAILASLFSHSLLAQEEILYFNRLNTQNGLMANANNYHVTLDSRGYAWVSSVAGLIRYDGMETKVYLPDGHDSLSLADPDIWSILVEDGEGRLWFNSATSVHYFEPGKQRFQRVPVELNGKLFIENRVLHFENQRNTLWFLSDKGVLGDFFPLFQMPVDKPGRVHLLDSIPHYWPYGVQIYPSSGSDSHYLLLPQTKGWEIRQYRGRERLSIRSFPKVRSEKFQAFAFYPEHDSILWVGTLQGLVKTNLDGSIWRMPGCFQGKCIEAIRGIVPYDSNTLLVATEESGLYLFDKRNFRYTHQIYFVEAGYVLPFEEAILRIHLDSQRNLWICTRHQGVFYTNLDKKRFPGFLKRRLEMRENSNVRALTEGPEGHIWCATERGLILVSKDGATLPPENRVREFNAQTRGMNLYHIACDSEGNIWVSSNKGLFVLPYGTESFSKVLKNKDLPGRSFPVFTFLYESREGSLFASTYGEGIYEIKKSGRSFEIVRPEPHIDDEGPHLVIFEDSADRLYFSRMRSWIRIFTQEEGVRKFLQDVQIPAQVYAFAEDPDSSWIWVGSSQGLYRLEWQTDSFRLEWDSVFSSRYPLVNGLLFDEEDRMWISTSMGLIQYNPPRGKDQNQPDKRANYFREFGVSDGLQDSEFNFLSFTKTSENKLAFGGVNGFNLFDPSDIPPYPLEVHPTITRILINEEPLEDSDHARLETGEAGKPQRLILKPSVRTFRLNFASMEFGYSGTRQFEYQLKRKNGTLIDRGSDNFASYINLDAGNYLFELDAFNSENVRSSKPLRLEISVQPHWTETWWFYTLLLLIFLAIVYTIYRNRLDQARKKQQLAELETAILRVQMNPHFIFNSLNSILSYIRDKDLDSADAFLMYFARLMRKILNQAERPFNSLFEEKQLLEEYMKIEALRFDQAFSYEFHIAPDLDTDETVVPTMILQPFVENSIIHGFRGKKEAGRIILRFWKNGSVLHCSVTDNGIGRRAAGSTPKKHDSKALEITRKRLRLIREQTGRPTRLEIIDLKDEEGKPRGTRVQLTLPLL